MSWELYRITCLVNGKAYIGLTNNSRVRFQNHKRIARTKQKGATYMIHHAMAKYGLENFEFEVIDRVPTLEEAKSKEIAYIKYYGTFGAGYNLTPGGDGGGCPSIWWRSLSDDERKALALQLQANCRKWWDALSEAEKEDCRQRRSKALRDWSNNMSREVREQRATQARAWWQNMSEDEFAQMSVKMANKKKRRYIVTDPVGGEYKVHGLKGFCSENNLHQGAMNAVAQGKMKHYKRWKCRYDPEC